MFIWRLENEVRITLQTDHMTQAGDMGAAWGNEEVPGPKYRTAVVTAARNHDEGWRQWELAPEMDTATGLPVDFREVDRRQHTQFYAKGVDFIEPTDPHAAFFISMHATGLYLGRYGVDGLPAPERGDLPPHSRAFVDAEEKRQERLAGSLQLMDDDIWYDYRLLQLWDRLSIVLCHGWANARLGPLPLDVGKGTGNEPILSATRVDPFTVILDPFPFVGDEQLFPARTLVVPYERYSSWDGLNHIICSTASSFAEFRFVSKV